MRFNEYLENYVYYEPGYEILNYKLYCEYMDLASVGLLNESYLINEGIFDKLKDLNLVKGLIDFFNDIKEIINALASEFKLGVKEIIKAFKNRDVFGVLKAFGFNLKLMIKSINAFTGIIRKGILKIFEEMASTGVFQKIRSGALKVDEVLNRYPLLKKVAGIAVAGLLLYIWLNMTFIGDMDYDFNFGDLVAALRGSFSLADLFVSPSGLMLIALLGTGSLLGLSAPWLGKSSYNLIMGLSYTAFAKIKESALMAKIKKKLKFSKL